MSEHWISSFEGAKVLRLEEGGTLFRRGDRVDKVFLVREGQVFLRRALKDGGLLILHVASEGELVAEASLFAKSYHCDAITSTATTFAVLPRPKLLALMKSDTSQGVLAMAALKRSSIELQSSRTRVEIMRLRKIADRLDAYLELYGPPEAKGWVRVADWIGVTPPALYRELARRRD